MASPQSSQTPAGQEQEQPGHQKEMMDACESGDVLKLEQLFLAVGVKQGDPAIDPKYIEYPNKLESVPPSGPPPTMDMIYMAVVHKRPSIVEFLLTTYPDANINRERILKAAFRNPHLQTFKLLHSHSPSIVNFESSVHTSALMEACLSSDPLLPNYLLDNGADPNGGGFPGIGPLCFAVQSSQPLELIEKMVKSGAYVTPAVVEETIRKQRLDVLKLLLNRGWLHRPEAILERVRRTNDKEIIALAEKRLENIQKKAKREEEE